MSSKLYQKYHAYITGVALGDGNLSNPNGRAVRLRITCDNKYPKIITKIKTAISILLPKNKISIINRAKTYCDISCYSNRWEDLLGWKAKNGSKYKQKVRIPNWIKNDKILTKKCLSGLLETDGSVYYDRGYCMANFVTIIPTLSNDIKELIEKIGFTANKYSIAGKNHPRFNIRISKNTKKFLNELGAEKTFV